MRGIIDLHSLNFWSINIRIILAVLIGGIIGVERSMKNHTAGFRTHILVCLGSTLVMMTNVYIHEHYGEADPSRMAAQVISGIGFLGAGTILVTKYNQVKGLTTAAGLWTAACVGLAIGIGFYEGALATAFFIILIMTLFQRLKKTIEMRALGVDCYIVFKNMDSFKEFLVYCAHRGWVVNHVERVETKPHHDGNLAYSMTVDLNEVHEHEHFVQDVAIVDGIIEVVEYY
ncbi:MgtC/SapB family protein [Tuanshanicoccus lijuaniae]|uniref:MgtC/SapB family protein n=1 Tax=Aerococcaceae bacterium zg-1292 TaxID=2774330 RepID=UPI00193744BE|nr:MgtC/SapB family protein [Aerococcaceae bacterium zg-1292]